jgi:hypothetical protein
MTDYAAFEAPVYLWILACASLVVVGLAFGALAAYVLRIRFALDKIDDYEATAASRVDVQRELVAVHERLARLEKPEPIPVRYEPPVTLRDEASIELSEDTDVHPCLPWHTSVRS